MITLTTVCKHIDNVKPEDIGRAHKILCASGNFYLVENSRGLLDTDGQLLEYKVTFDRKGFHCTCPSGQRGFSNVHHASGVCQHVRIAVAASQEEKEAMRELNQAQSKEQHQQSPAAELYMTINGQRVDEQTIQRLIARKPAPVGNGRGFAAKPFSILK